MSARTTILRNRGKEGSATTVGERATIRKQLPLTKIGKATHVMHRIAMTTHVRLRIVTLKTPIVESASWGVFRDDEKRVLGFGVRMDLVLHLLVPNELQLSAILCCSFPGQATTGTRQVRRSRGGRLEKCQYQRGRSAEFWRNFLCSDFVRRRTQLPKVSLQCSRSNNRGAGWNGATRATTKVKCNASWW